MPTAPILLALAAALAAAPDLAVQGEVVDADTGKPLAGVFVQQVDGLPATFTDAHGRYAVTLDPGGPRALAFSAREHRALTLALEAGAHGRVDARLPRLALGAALPPAPAPRRAEAPALASALTVGFGGSGLSQADGAAVLTGWSLADYRLGGRLRWGPWLLEGDGAHNQTPVDVAGLSRTLNPAFSPSTWEAGGRAGRVFALPGGLDAALALAYRYHNAVPNNGDIPYTGNGTDFEQTRHALGPAATLAWRAPASPWSAELGGAWYPLVAAWAKAPGQPFAAAWGLEASAGVAYELAPGLRLGLRYAVAGWQGQGSDLGQALAMQVQVLPGAVEGGRP